MRVRVGSYTKNHLSSIMELFRLPKYKTGKVIFNMANQYNSLSHTKWMCKYHIVFTPKYRRKIIYNQYRESIKEILKELCRYKGVEIIEGHMMPDHVHLLVSIPPKMSVSGFMGFIWKIVRFFQKLFGIQRYCDCEVTHW